jgi:Protein kinase domain
MDTVTLLGPYRLVQRIGEGGMGVVHLALDPHDRTVAIKVLRAHVAADPQARDRLAREVSTLQRVRHPRVAEVLDADTEGDLPYVVTRYVPAPPLDDLVRLEGPLTGADLALLGDGLGEALAAIHAAGVVHRDLKPGNVLMLDGAPVVIDFGIAHVADEVRLTSTGLVMGTPGYLAPEVLDGHPVSQATDWWGWAATMAFAATGRAPFGRGPVEAVLDRVRRGQADLDGVPAELVPVLTSALCPDPVDRPAPGSLRLAVRDLWEASSVSLDESPRTQVLPARYPPTQALPAQYPPAGRQEPLFPPAPIGWASQSRLPATEPPPCASPAAPRPSRTGVLASGLVALCAVAAVVPVVTVIAGTIWAVLARTAHRTRGRMLRRRYEYGPRRGDVALAVASTPWHLVAAALTSVLAMVVPLLVGASTAFLVGLALGTDPSRALPLAAGALAASGVAWWGPGGTSLRRGSRDLARALTPGRLGQVLVAGLLLLVAVSAVVVLMQSDWPPDWTPLPGPPLAG